MKILRRLAFAFLFAGCCVARADDARPAPLSLYSFADLYRLTVSATPDTLLLASAPGTPRAPTHIPVAMAETSAVAEPRFTVTQVPSTRGWMLLLAGLAAASWVAHRRLTHGM